MFFVVSPMVYTIGMTSLLGILLFDILGNIFWPAKFVEDDCFFPEDAESWDGKISAKP